MKIYSDNANGSNKYFNNEGVLVDWVLNGLFSDSLTAHQLLMRPPWRQGCWFGGVREASGTLGPRCISAY